MPSIELVPVPETSQIEEESNALVVRARGMTVRTRDDYEAAGGYLQRLAALRRSIEKVFRDPKEKAFAAHRAITQAESTLLSGPKQAERIVRDLMTDFLVAEERERRLEEARLQAEERERALSAQRREADALAAAGDVEAGLALLEQEPAVPVIEIEPPKVDGITSRRRYEFEIYDAAAVKPAFLMPDERKIRKQVESMGMDAAGIVGGIRVWESKTLVVKS